MKKIILLFLLLATNCFCQPSSEGSYSDGSGYTEKNEVILTINPLNNCELRYDFYPNYDAYYDRKEEVYLVFDEGNWIKVDYINPNYRGYSVYNRTHYTIKDYDGDDITNFYPIHKKKFPYATRKTLLKEW
jgi:hypothetical protein